MPNIPNWKEKARERIERDRPALACPDGVLLEIKRLRGMGLELQQIAYELKIPFEQVENVFLRNAAAWNRGAAFIERRKKLGIKVYPQVTRQISTETRIKIGDKSRKYWADSETKNKKRNEQPRNKYKGVRRRCDSYKWEARIFLDGKSKYLGSFKTEDEAAVAYNKAVDLYFNGNGWKNKC